jgi:hypothetical protein
VVILLCYDTGVLTCFNSGLVQIVQGPTISPVYSLEPGHGGTTAAKHGFYACVICVNKKKLYPSVKAIQKVCAGCVTQGLQDRSVKLNEGCQATNDVSYAPAHLTAQGVCCPDLLKHRVLSWAAVRCCCCCCMGWRLKGVALWTALTQLFLWDLL